MARRLSYALHTGELMNGDSPAIEAVNLCKSDLHNEVLRGFSMSVPRVAMFGCAGVEGAGKSTFLKCLLDFCHFAEGVNQHLWHLFATACGTRAPLLPARKVHAALLFKRPQVCQDGS